MSGTPVFLVGTGRSGTTLVQRLLNSYSDTLIWGEHAGFLQQYSEAYNLLSKSPSMDEFSYSQNEELGDISAELFKDPERWQAWNNWFSKEDIKQSFRNHIESIFNPSQLGGHQLWGFKEIRYGRDDRVLEFLLELYPEAKFLFVVRNGLNTIESQLNTFHQANFRFVTIKRLFQLPLAIKIAKIWRSQNQNLNKFSKLYPDNCFFVRYEDIINDEQNLQSMLAFVGKQVTETQRDIMGMKSGRGSSYQKGSSENERWKRLGPIPLFILKRMLRNANKTLGY